VVYERSALFTNTAKSLDYPIGKYSKNLAFKMNKLKTKYNVLAQCKLESLSLSTALLAIY